MENVVLAEILLEGRQGVMAAEVDPQGTTAPFKPPGAEPFAPAGRKAGRGLAPRFRAPFKFRRGRSPLQNFF